MTEKGGDRSTKRRVIVFRGADGEDVPVVFDLTPDGMIAIKRWGVPEPVMVDARTASRVVAAFRDLQAQALQGVVWYAR